jgi:hypothetical protein
MHALAVASSVGTLQRDVPIVKFRHRESCGLKCHARFSLPDRIADSRINRVLRFAMAIAKRRTKLVRKLQICRIAMVSRPPIGRLNNNCCYFLNTRCHLRCWAQLCCLKTGAKLTHLYLLYIEFLKYLYHLLLVNQG